VISVRRPIHVVVVGYHAADELDACLAALGDGVEVTLVDNSSSSEVRAVAARREVEYLDPGENLGFAAGVNVALRRIQVGPPSDVLLLNPDAELTPQALERLARPLRQPERDRVAAISPRLVDELGREQRVAWPFPSPGRAWIEALGLGGRSPRRPYFVIGAVLLLRWEALREVGLFDERFFLYAEEADWQRRARALGWSSLLVTDAVASHRGAGTSSDSIAREALFHAAQETYIRKWYGVAGWWIYRFAAVLGAAARSLVLSGERRKEAARRARIYLRGPRRRAAAVRG
jgi:GT2 family glycosyltransferase